MQDMFLMCFELAVDHFGAPKIPKCILNVQLWDKNCVKNG